MKFCTSLAILAFLASTCTSFVIEANPLQPNRVFMVSAQKDKVTPLKTEHNKDDLLMVQLAIKPTPISPNAFGGAQVYAQTTNVHQHHSIELEKKPDRFIIKPELQQPEPFIDISKAPAHFVVHEQHPEPQNTIEISKEPQQPLVKPQNVIEISKEPTHYIVHEIHTGQEHTMDIATAPSQHFAFNLPKLPIPKYPVDYKFAN